MAHQNKNGFTLVELIIVVSIIAVLASLAFMALSGETAQARDSKRLADIKVFEDAIATSNGKNKKIDYNNNSELGSVPISYTNNDAAAYNFTVNTSSGTMIPLRGAYLIPVKAGLFDSDVIPTMPRDPKGSQYYAAFLSATDYQMFGSAENPDTKTATAIVRGSFKEGAIIDILMEDLTDPTDLAFKVSNPQRFVGGGDSSALAALQGDHIKIDSEEMIVRSFNTSTGEITVERGVNSTTAAVHNKSAAVKLKASASGADSLLCLGSGVGAASSIAATGARTALTDVQDFNDAFNDGSDTGVTCSIASSAATASAGPILDGGAALPYTVGAE